MIKTRAALCATVLPALLLVATHSSGSDDPLQEVARIVAAHGGRESVEMVESFGVRTGRFTQHFPAANTGTFVERRKGDMMLMELKLGGLEIAQGFDGKRAWLRSFGQVVDAPDQIQESIEQGLRHSTTLLLRAGDPGYEASSAPPDTAIDGTRLDGVVIQPPEGPSTSFYVDPNTQRIAKITYTDTNPYQGGESRFESYILGYMKAGGVLFPSRTVHMIDGIKMNEVQYDSVDFATDIESDVFMRPGDETAESKAGDNFKIEVPLDYSLSLLFVEVSIGDSAYSFILDTGAGLTCLSRELAGGIEILETGGMSAAGAGGSLDATTGRIEEIRIGDLIVRDLAVMVIDIAPMAEMMGRRIDGIIGYNVLNRYSTTIDIAGGRLTFEGSETPLPSGEEIVAVPFQVYMGIPVVEATVDGAETLDFMIDTGATMSVLPRAVATKLNPGQELEGAVAAGADSRQIEMAVARFDELAIGEAIADDPVLSYPLTVEKTDPIGSAIDTANRGVIGTAILSKFVVTLNYDTAKMAFRQADDGAGENLEWCGPGLTVVLDSGKVVVRSVYKDGPAEGKIEAGDRIIEIDGSPVEGANLEEIVGRLRGNPGTKVEIVIENKNGVAKVTLPRVKLL